MYVLALCACGVLPSLYGGVVGVAGAARQRWLYGGMAGLAFSQRQGAPVNRVNQAAGTA